MDEDTKVDEIIEQIVSYENKKKINIRRDFVEIERCITNNLQFGKYWIWFEKGKFEIIETKFDKCHSFKFPDGEIIGRKDFWSMGVGKLKTELFKIDIGLEFLTVYSNFTGSELSIINFDKNIVNLPKNGSDRFQHSRLQDFTFRFTRFYKCEFQNVFIGSNLLDNCVFENCVFNNCNEEVPQDQLAIKQNADELLIMKCTFNNCNLSNFDFKYSVFRECKFKECTWGFCNYLSTLFVDSILENSELWNSTFKSGAIEDCKFTNVDLQECLFSYSKLTNAIFSKCDLRRAKFYECNLIKDNYSFQDDGIIKSFNENSSRFEYCSLNSADFSTMFIDEFEYLYNKYNKETKFSLTYYEDMIKLYLPKKDEDEELSEEELEILLKMQNAYELKIISKCIALYYNLFTEYKNTLMLDTAYEYYFKLKCLELKKSKLEYVMNKDGFKGLRKKIHEVLKIKYQEYMYKLCGFGERPLWAFKKIIKLIIICAAFYMLFGIESSKSSINYMEKLGRLFSGKSSINIYNIKTFFRDLGISLYFSLITFSTVGYGDYSPSLVVSKIVVSFQIFLSLLYTSTFTATFIRKALRD